MLSQIFIVLGKLIGEPNLKVTSDHKYALMGWKVISKNDVAISVFCKNSTTLTCGDFIENFIKFNFKENCFSIYHKIPTGRKSSRIVNYFVVFLDQYKSRWIRKIIADFKDSFFWDVAQTKILLISFSLDNEDNIRIVKTFSEEHIPKVAVLLPNSSFLIHNRFLPGNNLKILPGNSSLDEVFPNKLRHLHGFEFRLSQYGIFPRSMVINDRVYGFDGHLLDTILEYFNSTYQLMAPGWSPDIFYRTVDDVLHDKADFNFNLRILFEKSYQEAKISWLYPLRVNSLCVVVPHAPPRSVVDAILQPLLSLPTLIYLIFMMMVLIALILSIRTDPLTIVFNVVRISTLSPIPRLAGTQTESVLVVSSLFLSFFFINRMQSIVTAFLVWPGFNDNIHTVAELNASRYSILIPDGVMELMESVNHGYDEYFLKNKFVISDLRPEHARHLAAEDLNGFVVYAFNVDPRALNAANEDGTQPLLHLMDECLFHSIASYVFQKHSPFVAPFNRVLQQIHEAGLLNRWTDIAAPEIVHLNRSMDRLYGIAAYQSRKLNLGFDDLYFTFYLYYIGVALGTVVFTLELLLYHRQCVAKRIKKFLC
ncbi:hypothetical protein DMENIID0001_127120 [Sergentomyia squamirostris]